MPIEFPDAYVVNLDNFRIIQVTGEDAKIFLQSQLTSDISGIKPGDTKFSSWCNPQGRIITTMLVQYKNNSYNLLVPEKLAELFISRISIFILRSKVTLLLMDNSVQITGISSNTLLGTVRDLTNKPECINDVLILDVPGSKQDRGIMITNKDIEEKIFNQIPNIKKYSTSVYWENQDIIAGIPWITESTTEKLLPQDLGLERLDALSFNKGCYPGQEIIARLHYRGKEKYGLYRGIILSNTQPPPVTGDRLYLQDNSTNIGTLVSVVSLTDDEIHCLATLKHENFKLETFTIENKATVNINFSAINTG